MNAATASGIVGRQLAADFTPGPRGPESGVCHFASMGDINNVLTIEVSIMKSVQTEWPSFRSKCGSGAKPLKAIGNEAVECSSDGQRRVIGRVRDQAFTIKITAPGVTSERAKKAAEIVAGNLF
jgi:hypothetical protein